MNHISSKPGSARRYFVAVKKLFFEFCEETSIHGVHYLAERKRSFLEKIFWILIFAVVLSSCGLLIQTVWIKWHKTPVIVTFSDRSTPVWKVPFPTITICPDTRASAEKFSYSDELEAYENSNNLRDWDTKRLMIFDAMAQVCEYKFSKDNELGFQYANGSFKQMLMDVAPEFNVDPCKWKGDDYDWRELFDLILTERGICYSFNFLNASDIYREDVLYEETIVQQTGNRRTKWKLEMGFVDEAKHEIFPYRLSNAYIKNGLIAAFSSYASDRDKVCTEGDEGYKISIDTPGDIPQLSKYYYTIPFNQEVLIDITPEIIEASESTKEYSSEIRQCFFASERELRFFKIYSQSNCEFECLTNYTLQKCGCVRFNMPRVEGTRICAEDKVPCYQRAKRQMIKDTFEADHMTENSNVTILANCNCLPPCRSLTYSVGISQGEIGKEMKDFMKLMDIRASIFKIYYKEARFWAKQRSKFYGFIDFVAHAGGLLGLFMGISVVSFIEILYFILMRVWGNFKNEKQNQISQILSK